MGLWGRTARRLGGAGAIALALTAAAVPVPAPGPPPPVGWLAAPLPGGERDPGGPAGPLLGVVGYKPAVLARLDPRTLRPLPGPRVRLPYGVSAYGWPWSPVTPPTASTC